MTEAGSESKSGGRFEGFGRRVDRGLGTAIPRIQEEVKKVVDYLNDEVVPNLRQDSSQALRSAAERLQKLADHLDDNRSGGGR
jgi:hypothetical protein